MFLRPFCMLTVILGDGINTLIWENDMLSVSQNVTERYRNCRGDGAREKVIFLTWNP